MRFTPDEAYLGRVDAAFLAMFEQLKARRGQPGRRCPQCGAQIIRRGEAASYSCPDCGGYLSNTVPESVPLVAPAPSPDETERPPRHRKHVQDCDSDNLDGSAVEIPLERN